MIIPASDTSLLWLALPIVFGFWGTLLKVLTGIGPIAAGAAKGSADGRLSEAQINAQRDRTELDKYQAQQQALVQQAQMQNQNELNTANLDLQRRGYADTAPKARFQQSMLGNLAANMQDVSASHPRANVVHFSGGMRPSAIGPGGRAAGSELARQAMMRLMKGDEFDPMKTTNFDVLQAPNQTPLPKAGWFDKLLSGLGYAGAATGAMQEMGIGQPTPTPSVPAVHQGLPSNMPGTQVPSAVQPPPFLNSKNIFWGR